ncbi:MULTISPECIES: PspC domain-containing protein [unclassified Clostridium]|uniref:PspC domain-containing protein n=1 Tax=unclassified Clostridium TaxID=2614128 RepID=UPI0002983D8F|nr:MULTISPECIES: PspC domain-containing protein [unclassified Clostridium]EKQ55396.1 MAG: putative stress-responsive transcriptional regulator [Clostridium sp. Maddingley MBC34-26]
MIERKKLYKDVSRRKISGVLAGFSEYINGDVTLIRILFVLLTTQFFTICVITYFICAIIMPDKQDIFNNPNEY